MNSSATPQRCSERWAISHVSQLNSKIELKKFKTKSAAWTTALFTSSEAWFERTASTHLTEPTSPKR